MTPPSPHPNPFAVAGTIAQWYFAPVLADPSLKRGRVHRTLRAALGPSFGSLCFGGLVLTVLSLLRSVSVATQDSE